jgi:hypothetical protein
MKRINDYVIIEEGINRALQNLISRNFPKMDFGRYYQASYEDKKYIVSDYLMNVGIEYRKEFHELWGDLTEFEKLLYATDKLYRDHVLHTFRVWGLGLYLSINGLNKFIDPDESDKFHLSWYIASIYHDIGYPLANLKKLEKELSRYFSYLDLRDIVSLGTGIQNKLSKPELKRKINKLLPHENIDGNVLLQRHGLTSARLLLFQLMQRFPNGWMESANIALKAIADHDGDRPIFFHEDPISALLIICDELQEWGRPYISSRLADGNMITDHIELYIESNGSTPRIEAKIDYRNSQLNLHRILQWEGEIAEKSKVTNLKRIDGIIINVKMKYFKKKELLNS